MKTYLSRLYTCCDIFKSLNICPQPHWYSGVLCWRSWLNDGWLFMLMNDGHYRKVFYTCVTFPHTTLYTSGSACAQQLRVVALAFPTEQYSSEKQGKRNKQCDSVKWLKTWCIVFYMCPRSYKRQWRAVEGWGCSVGVERAEGRVLSCEGLKKKKKSPVKWWKCWKGDWDVSEWRKSSEWKSMPLHFADICCIHQRAHIDSKRDIL